MGADQSSAKDGQLMMVLGFRPRETRNHYWTVRQIF